MLETVYYSLGIVSMSVFLLMVVSLLLAVWYAKRHVEKMRSGIAGKIMGFVKGKNVEIASAIGLTVVHFIIDKLRGRSNKS